MKHANDSKRTYMLITIPILALFVCFNTIPLDPRCHLQLYKLQRLWDL